MDDDDIIMSGLMWLAPPASKPPPPPTEQELEALALGEYLVAVDRVILVSVASCMVGCDSRDVGFSPPARFRVVRTSQQDICHWNDEWLDPYWNVEPIDQVSPEASSWWVHGPSRNLDGSVEPSIEWTWEKQR